MNLLATSADIEGALRRRAAYALDPDLATSLGWTPWPKQKTASETAREVDEFLFGGAAGPGKTEWLMRHGIEEMERHPGNRGVIFRRVFPSLRRTIIPRLQAILAGRATFNKNESTFTFPNSSVLECASLQYSTDVHDYQGAEYGWIGFEEITEFLEDQYEYLLTRLRVPGSCTSDRIRPHVCSTTNPGGVGHKWVKRRWVKPKEEDLDPGQPRPASGVAWRPRWDPKIHSVDAPPLVRCYLAAIYSDNPALLERDPGYLARLRSQSRRGLREALESGDWDKIDAVEGALWEADVLDRGRVAPDIYRRTVEVMRRIVAVDPSDGDDEGDAYGVAVCSRGLDGCGYVEETYGWHLNPNKLIEATIRLAKRTRAHCIVVEKNHGGKWIPAAITKADRTMKVTTVWASDNKRTRAEPIAALFEANEYREPEVMGRLVGFQEALEDELTGTSFTSGEPSPNLLDAMVWGLTDLMIGTEPVTKSETPTSRQRLQAARRR